MVGVVTGSDGDTSMARTGDRIGCYAIGWLSIIMISTCLISQLVPAHAATTSPPQTYDNVFAYCRALKGHARREASISPEEDVHPGYSGPSEPAAVVAWLHEPTAAWRCMGGQVYACYPGADGGACAHETISVTPPLSFWQFCEQHPGSDFLPMFLVSGWASRWACQGTRPVVTRLLSTDRQGFLAGFWSKITPKHQRVSR